MQAILERLVAHAGDQTDLKRQTGAILQLRLWLELNTYTSIPANLLEFYEEELPDDLRSLRLTECDERAVVGAIEKLVLSAQSADERYSLISVLSAASPRYAIEPVLRLLIRWKAEGWPHELAWSIMYALDRALDVFDEDSADHFYSQVPVVVAAIRRHDPRPTLDELAAVPDDRVARLAQSVRRSIEKCLEAHPPR